LEQGYVTVIAALFLLGAEHAKIGIVDMGRRCYYPASAYSGQAAITW
jgi:hypothetical protein